MAHDKSKKKGAGNPIDDLHKATGAGMNIITSRTETSRTETSGTETSRNIGGPLDTREGPVGIDMGTSRIVGYYKEGLKFVKHCELNAFFTIPNSNFTADILKQNKMLHKQNSKEIFVIGNASESFANISNGEVRRPMASGLLNPLEKNGITVIEEILKSMVKKPRSLGEKLSFGLPAPTRGSGYFNPVFHESVIKNYFVAMGYMAKGVTEGYLVVLSELQKDNFTGIGISCGGGLCNVCLSYLSVPVITFSITKAGDYIDTSSSAAVGEHENRVRVIKEESLNLIAEPKNRVEKALQIYYEEMILSLIRNLKEELEESEHMPKINTPMPLVLTGGTAMPEGFRDKFDNMLRESHFPIDISEVRLAEDPLYTIARGAYLSACADVGSEE